MLKQLFIFWGLLTVGTLAQAAANPQVDLCTQFAPANNKQFTDTFSTNFLSLTRTNHQISGSFRHAFGGNNAPRANITGNCNNNQVAFSWNGGKNFYGQFSGTLKCVNDIYNLVGVLAVINGIPVEINVMVSPPSGRCPSG